MHLNHGSFGACPTAVLQAQRDHRDRMERDAVSLLAADLSRLLDRSREALAPLMNVQPDSIVLVRNATFGVVTALQHAARVGFDRGPLGSSGEGEEILVPEHEYNACRHNAQAIAESCGARIKEVALGIPTAPIACASDRITADLLYERVMAAVTDRSRVCLLSLITSPSGIRLPVERLIPALRERGVETILDAAHGVGCIPLDLANWQPAFFTSNAHKWLCAPKGAAVFWARDDVREHVRPLVLSNNAATDPNALPRSRWQTEFDYAGTDDPTGWLSIADATCTVPKIAGTDWTGIMQRNRELVLQGRDTVCKALGVHPPSDDDLIGPMAIVPLASVPTAELTKHPTRFGDPLWDRLQDHYRISIPVFHPFAAGAHDQQTTTRVIRLSAQLYNSPEQYEYLAQALVEALAGELREAPMP